MSRRGPVTEGQWAMARTMREGAPATSANIAALLDVDVSAVYARAAAEGWRSMDFRRQDVLEAFRHAVALAASYRGGDDDEPDGEQGDAGAALQSISPDALRESTPDAPQAGPSHAPADGEASPGFLADAGAFVSRQLARLIARADRNGGRLDKAQIDSLIALSRMTERWEAGALERAKQDIKKSDDELAAILKRVNDRIIHLARELAARMVAEKLRPGGSEAGGSLAQ